MKLFALDLPVGWQELSTIITALGVFVALSANWKTSKQLKVSLLMQEQSKNVELFEKRIQIIEKIDRGEEVSSTSIRLLFNDNEILRHYDDMLKYKALLLSAKDEKEVYFQAAAEVTDIKGNPLRIKDNIEQYEYSMSMIGCPQTIIDSFNQYCNENKLYWSKTGFSDHRKTYNYAEIRSQILDFENSFDTIKRALIILMETFTEDSVTQI